MLLRRVLQAADDPAQRAPWDDFWYTADGIAAQARSSAGMNVTPESALTIGAVFRAVRLLADDIAQLPLHQFAWIQDRENGLPGGKERLKTDLARVIGKRPNPRQTSFEWRQMMSAHVLLRGNGYSRVVAGARGTVDQLVPLHPARVRPQLLDSGRVLYLHRGRAGREERLNQEEVFHLRGFSVDPESPEGLAPVTLARTALGVTMATEEFAARQFSQTPRPSFILTHPRKLDAPVRDRIQDSFRSSWSGKSGWGGAPILEEGMTATAVGMSHDDAQFLQTREFQVTDVARWFGVPPHMIGDLRRSTNNNIEQQSIDYLLHSLLPWLVLWEQSVERDLVLDETFFQFVVDGLLRGDAVTRATAHQLYVNMRARTPNEVRAMENMNPVPWGDAPAMPQGAPAPQGPPAGAPRKPPVDDDADDDQDDADDEDEES